MPGVPREVLTAAFPLSAESVRGLPAYGAAPSPVGASLLSAASVSALQRGGPDCAPSQGEVLVWVRIVPAVSPPPAPECRFRRAEVSEEPPLGFPFPFGCL